MALLPISPFILTQQHQRLMNQFISLVKVSGFKKGKLYKKYLKLWYFLESMGIAKVRVSCFWPKPADQFVVNALASSSWYNLEISKFSASGTPEGNR